MINDTENLLFMSFLITDSTTILNPQALPALKITEFYQTPFRGCIYSYLQCFIYHGNFHYFFTVFDENPPPTQYAAITLSCQTTPLFLTVHLQKEKNAKISVIKEKNNLFSTQSYFSAEKQHHICGNDEQGIYWRSSGIITKEVFKCVFEQFPKAGSVLFGNLFLYDITEQAFGSAFPVCTQAPQHFLYQGLRPFMIVPY